MILSCKSVTKSFGEKTILNHVSFHMNERDKVAVVGNNGAGKSTLLKILIGELPADAGEVILAPNLKVGYISQRQDFRSEKTVYEELLSVKQYLLDTEKRIRELELAMNGKTDEALAPLLLEYTSLTNAYEAGNGYAYKSEVVGVCKGLGFCEAEFSKKVADLSGGQKTRIALGRLLLTKPDLIVLDEPTNHLDMSSISWLETFLQSYPGAVLIVAHDRYFLDRIVTSVIELENGLAQRYEGNYSAYAVSKKLFRETSLMHYLNQQREIRRQEEIITKLRSFHREKAVKRADSREKLLEKTEFPEKPVSHDKTIRIRLTPRIISGNDVLSVDGISKAFGDTSLFSEVGFEIRRGEKVAIIGKNGVGKTTLLKIILGLISADSGTVKTGAKVHIAYYDQEHRQLDPEKTIFDEISDAYPHMDNTAIRNTLAAFLFTGDDVFKTIAELSGGECGRVALAKLMLSEANFLILDEPTNHLDMLSKEILESALNSYEGTLLYVSHDRYFINKTADRILDLTGQTVVSYSGNYDYYLEKKDENERQNIAMNPSKAGSDSSALSGCKEASESKTDWQQKKEEQARLRKSKNDLLRCENEIEKTEKAIHEVDEALSNFAGTSDLAGLEELSAQRESLENTLNELMLLWTNLAERQ